MMKTNTKKGSEQMAKAEAKPTNGNGANLGFEASLWKAADALRSNMDAAEYKHIVLGLIFLKYISDAFEERYQYLAQAVDAPDNDYYLATTTRNRADAIKSLLEDPDEYRAENIFWVPRRRGGRS